MSRCRFAWFEHGAVKRHVPGRAPQDVPANEARYPAELRTIQGVLVVVAEIDGSTWSGRLMPKKNGLAVGPVALFQSPAAART
jgi:hypothetical protein